MTAASPRSMWSVSSGCTCSSRSMPAGWRILPLNSARSSSKPDRMSSCRGSGRQALCDRPGDVDVFIKDETGKEHFLDCMEDGDYFGEMALLLNQPRSATVRTVTPSLLLSLSREQLFRMLEAFPECRAAIDQRIAESQPTRPQSATTACYPQFNGRRGLGAQKVAEYFAIQSCVTLRRASGVHSTRTEFAKY